MEFLIFNDDGLFSGLTDTVQPLKYRNPTSCVKKIGKSKALV